MLKTVKYPDPILSKVANPVTQETIENGIKEYGISFSQFCQEMFGHCLKEGGVGLAAPQVGVPLAIFVVCYKNQKLFINPKLTHIHGYTLSSEGCLSCPGLVKKVRRMAEFSIEYKDLSGKIKIERYNSIINFEGKIIQHEYDHLIGKTIAN